MNDKYQFSIQAVTAGLIVFALMALGTFVLDIGNVLALALPLWAMVREFQHQSEMENSQPIRAPLMALESTFFVFVGYLLLGPIGSAIFGGADYAYQEQRRRRKASEAGNQQNKQSRQRNDNHFSSLYSKTSRGNSDIESYYLSLMNLKKGADLGDVQYAYKRTLSKYHPDKVNHMGEDIQKLADSRTRELMKAYRHLHHLYSEKKEETIKTDDVIKTPAT